MAFERWEPKYTYEIVGNDDELQGVNVSQVPNEKFLFSIGYKNIFQSSIDFEHELFISLARNGPKSGVSLSLQRSTPYMQMRMTKRLPRLRLVCRSGTDFGTRAKRRRQSLSFLNVMVSPLKSKKSSLHRSRETWCGCN
jgi:hypothetical protein